MTKQEATEQERLQRLARALRSLLPPDWVQDMARVTPDNLLRDIVRDSRAGVSPPASLASRPGSAEDRPRTSGGGTAPLTVSGVNHVDAIAESFARRDRLVAEQQRRELEWIEMLLEKKSPHRAKTSYDPFSRSRMGVDDE